MEKGAISDLAGGNFHVASGHSLDNGVDVNELTSIFKLLMGSPLHSGMCLVQSTSYNLEMSKAERW